MHLGNMKFKQKPREEQVEADGTESKTFFEDMAFSSNPYPRPTSLALQLTSPLGIWKDVEINQQSLSVARLQNYSLDYQSDVESLYLRIKSIP